MKPILLLLLGAVMLVGCKKQFELRELRRDIEGQWELEQSVNPWSSEFYPPNNGNRLRLSKDGYYERIQNHQVVFAGKYYLDYRKDCHSDKETAMLDTNDSVSTVNERIEVADGQLRLATSSCMLDGGIAIYRRVN